ncbi:unnamed protein product [Lymnaea stagnalis]|uniref:HD domain-containing protein n=1 Tax=Lymnaea stagnalis TaxID=6523 RepID=A0AAV2HQZ2_LYMST
MMSNLDGSDEQASPCKRLCIRPNGDTTSPDVIQNGINWQDWNNDQLISKMRSEGLDENIVLIFENYKSTGRDLKGLTVDALMTMGAKSYIDCMSILKVLGSIGAVDKLEEKYSKVFNDPIHGHIEVHPACIAIIDTPQFQRLRYLKQLGMCYFVFPGAAHNRFEHSLGVYYLAGQFVRILRQNQPYLGITDKDILCVEIAGLCHDLGHGPFSHLFDGKFMPAVNPARKWKHEKASLDMLDYLIADNQLMEPGGALHQYGIDQTDIIFIKEQIYGPLDVSYSIGDGILKGRPKHKHYLYEIVSNKRNEIDVDKWDYFARDCHHLGIQQNFDHFRFMKFARVIEHEGSWQICTRDKEIGNLYNMFYTRYTLHRTAYQHRVSSAIETMVAHALIKANDHLEFFRKDGTTCKMSECIDDMSVYSELTDEVIFKILYSESQENDMKEAKSIIQRIFNRDLYVCVCQSKPVDAQSFKWTTDEIRAEVLEKARAAEGGQVTEADLVVQITYLDFGMKHQNPVERLLVYSKSEPDKARYLPKIEASRVLGPLTFSELLIRVLSCKKEKSSAIEKAAKQWCEEKLMKLVSDGWENQILLTPPKEPTEAVGNKTPVTAGKQRSLFSSFSTVHI